jgi:beta-galactosidase
MQRPIGVAPLLVAALAAFATAPRTARAETPGPAVGLDPWEDPQVVGIHKLAPHAPVYPFADAGSAATLERSRSPYYRLLNGRWKFRFSPNPDSRPAGFQAESFDDAAWAEIDVPANIEKQGYAPPVYLNIP